MTALAQHFKEKFFREPHPYQLLERTVAAYLRPEHTLLDAGCGRTAPILEAFKGKAQRLIGVDLVDFDTGIRGLELHQCDLAAIPIEDQCVDIVMSRSVMEHITDPASVYRELSRILKPGGLFIFLTANLWDYASLIAWLVPNRFHSAIVSRTEGRAERDVFPVTYRTNTRRAVEQWAKGARFEVVSTEYLGQYPSYFMFNGLLFLFATAYQKVIARTETLKFLQGWLFVILRKTSSS